MGRTGLRIWGEGLRGGVACLGSDYMLALKRLILPVSYWRTAEFAYLWCALRLAPGSSVLDLGSPKDIAAWLAKRRGYALTSIDVVETEVEYSARYAAATGVLGRGPGHVYQLLQDGRNLEFRDASFDAAYSISVLEHIPGDGDSLAMAELVRVVRPGGHVIFTVPFANQYRETFVAERVYEREYSGEPVFFERHYDLNALERRLVNVPSARLADLQLWGERLPVEKLLGWDHRLRGILSPLEPFFALASLRQVTAPEAAKAAFVTMHRT
jgi:SAM-dependent methyltransferase